MFKRFLFFIIFCLFALTQGICDSWSVCLGSFKIRENAEKLVESLRQENIQAAIYLHESENGTFYRVLLKQSFDFINEARKMRDEINNKSVIRNLDISGLWACAASSEELQSKTVVLQSNKIEDIPVSIEKPYSVMVRSYKEEQAAINDKERLNENDVNAYILKTFDDSSYFSFNLHAGAFDTVEEVEDLQEKLEDLGIEDTKISNYEDIADNVEKYNEVIETQNVIFEDGNYTIPTSFSSAIITSIRQFPVNKNFQIERISIFDIDNINTTGAEVSGTEKIDDFIDEINDVHAVSIATYKDDLFDKNVMVFMAVGDDGCFKQKEFDGAEDLQLAIVDDVLDCAVLFNDNDCYLQGTNRAKNMLVGMISKDFTKGQFSAFINNISNDSSLLVYPQLRKTLLVLPERNDSLQRDFLAFTLSRIGESYAAERSYSDWSVPIVGHWNARSEFFQDNQKLSISFFDMDYDYNAN
ncbi:MAG: SPOR domain-containing protein, partial [Spirochaetales bacterium]|nr:SPOR domain-containing protein [Spirochaetales bacterium]